ncbi:MAG: radical SAM protein [Hoeflea sp.]|uniref:radical SAM/SPASM domain-containing protein n=1 Tax=Hoeflea sp. TaxID=1940281 RepID=UPI001E11F7C8|nr:radical SAM protein [Hoeflea sp.]MBU4531436.1 radical SAM protein [Alphaproteobacteria bacterium]MBU4544293.1 radical SAM protein [Alphaproteobacteria bacterium]MBU4550470.1 radical SAM protein [Alphaproteobacteria bacterium]MBV1724712.1 radical SAM protein [Hoeflea sp.]MBV1760732.1 radical SAM protein [Hoeflea sp.]
MSPSIPSGTAPQPVRNDAAKGRFTIVSGSQGDYIFLPEVCTIFEAPGAVIAELEDFRSDAFSKNLPGEKPYEAAARSFFESFIEGKQPPPGPTTRGDAGLKDLVLNISQICNLACSYCYAEDLNKSRKIMLPETCRAAIDRALLLSRDGLKSVKFLGGEPALAFREICLTVEYVEEKCTELGFPTPSFVIVTNGTLVTDEMIAFFALKNFYVLVSMDGNQSIHDTLRPFSGGRGSYAKVSDTIAKFQQFGSPVAVEAVYTRTHYQNGVGVKDVVAHLLGLGVREMQITLALGSWHGEGAYAEIEAVSRDFSEVARACIRSFLSDDPFLLRGIQFVIDGFVNRTKNSHVCGAGRSFMAVNYDGEAFPCYLLESAETSYGFIGKEWDQDRYSRISKKFVENGKDYHETCGKCWANEICQSCLGSSFLLEKKIAKPPAWFCGVQKTLISAVLGEIGDALNSPQKQRFLENLAEFLRPRLFEA